jgi:hypothetical protein
LIIRPARVVLPLPLGDSPDKRTAWHAAFAALGPADGVVVRGLPDGALLQLRESYAAETAWAPRHVGRELRHLRASADDAGLAAIRARAEEHAARQRDHADAASWHAGLARSWTAMETFYRQQGPRFEPLKSAEPVVTDAELGQLQIKPEDLFYQQPEWVAQLADERRATRQQLDDRRNAQIPVAGPHPGYEGQAWPAWTTGHRDAVLQPPKPDIRPSQAVLDRAAQVDVEAEH